MDWIIAFGLTFAIARYGLGALFGMLPWLWFAIARGRGRGAHSQLLPWRSGWQSPLGWRTPAN